MTPMAISSVPDIVLVLPYARQWQGQNQASRAAGGLAIGEFKVTRIKDGKSVPQREHRKAAFVGLTVNCHAEA